LIVKASNADYFNSKAYLDEVFSEEVTSGQWRRYPIGFNNLQCRFGFWRPYVMDVILCYLD
jgi:hypothetical protein